MLLNFASKIVNGVPAGVHTTRTEIPTSEIVTQNAEVSMSHTKFNALSAVHARVISNLDDSTS